VKFGFLIKPEAKREGDKMYKEHEIFEKPEDQKARIWRYMDFTKFLSLLTRGELFFPRADKLGDPFEGSFSKKNIEKRPEYYGNVLKYIPEAFKKLSDYNKMLLEFTFINCWHLNDNESAAMWKIYIQKGEGIAIQSTFTCLCDSFAPSKRDIYVGCVKYLDYESEWIPENNSLQPFLHKRKSFEYEKELRAIFHNFPSEGEEVNWSQILFERKGIYVSVDLSALIEKIYVSPESSDWFIELVQSIITTYKMKFEVKRSRVDGDPVY
jgi:hypothetical protein